MTSLKENIDSLMEFPLNMIRPICVSVRFKTMSVQVWILAVSVPTTHRGKHKITSLNSTFVHLPQVYILIVGSQGIFGAVRLLADITYQTAHKLEGVAFVGRGDGCDIW